MKQPFVHLHVHSEYSFVDGSIRIPSLIETVKSFGQSHVALTDHSNMHGAIDFYFKAHESGITPIVGCEIYVKNIKDPSKIHQLVLLAKDNLGYKNLLKIVSTAYIGENFKNHIPSVPFHFLEQNTEGLVAISSFHNGEFRYLSSANSTMTEDLQSYAETMTKAFPNESFYIEITKNNLPDQDKNVDIQAQFAKELGLPLIASSNAHYLSKDFSSTHALAIAIKNSLTLKSIDNRLHNTNFHLASSEEMNGLFSDYPEALANTLKVAEACSHLNIETGKYYFPKIDLDKDETAMAALSKKSEEGLRNRFKTLDLVYGESFNEEEKKTYWKRLEYELGIIAKTGFADYFLIVQDFIQWSKSQGIPVGPGRGSGAGSLVAYSLLITDLDPIRYDLIFERFLNPERISMPDFDIDFCQWRREEVIQYCIKKYGKNNVAQITTFGKMNAKGAVKAVGRAKGLGFNRVDQFTKLFPNDLGLTLANALEQEPRIKEEMTKNEELRECMDEAMKLEGLCSHTSVHAAGIVMSDGDMTDYVPIYTTDGSSYITQYEMKPTEKVGLVKFDFLGLKTLTVIDKAIAIIKAQKDPNFDINTIPLDESKVFQLMSEGHTVGVFQCESFGITQLIKKMKPSCFDDMIALVALYRPGPLGSGMVDDFLKNKHGKQKIKYLLPELEPILKESYGLILYQDQVLRIASALAGYSLGEADLLRKAMGKKIAEEMAKQKERFLSGAKKNNLPEDKSEEIFDLMAEFAKYGFNKAHSAAYGMISYQTAYLKTYSPEAYLAACMTCDMDNTDKIVRYVEEAKRLKIKVLTPNINRSSIEFLVPKEGTIDFALSAIKGLGESSITPLLKEREENGVFRSITDLAQRVHLGKLGKKNLQLLIACGALDDFRYPRQSLDSISNRLVEYSIDQHEAKQSGQRGLFELSSTTTKVQENCFQDYEYLKVKDGERTWSIRDLFIEKKLLGTFISSHPLEIFNFDRATFSSLKFDQFENLVKNQHGKIKVSLVALMTKVEQRRTKRGSLIAYIHLEQEDHRYEGVMFQSALEASTLPPINSIVFIEGTVDKLNEDMGIRFNIDKITDIQDLRKSLVKHLNFHIDLERTSKSDIAKLKTLVTNFPGEVPIRFYLKNKHASLKINTPKWHIKPSNEFLSQTLQIQSLQVQFRN